MDTPTLLIAVGSQDTRLVHDVLGDEFSLLICHSFQEAEALIGKDIDLVTSGIHFDLGRMFDLLKRVRSTPKLHDVPFLLALGREVKYSPAILQDRDRGQITWREGIHQYSKINLEYGQGRRV